MSVINAYHPRGAHTIRPVSRSAQDNPSGNKPASPQTNPTDKPSKRVEQHAFDNEQTRSHSFANNLSHSADDAILHGQFDQKPSEYAVRAVAVYRLHAEINHRQHIQTLLGIDEYA